MTPGMFRPGCQNTKHIIKITFQLQAYTAFLLEFMHIYEPLLSFVACQLHIYTHAILCGATYHLNWVKVTSDYRINSNTIRTLI